MPRNAVLAAGQFRCAIGDKMANLRKMEAQAKEAAQAGAQLICFPELCTTGLDVERLRELAEPVPGETVERLATIARTNHLYLIAGMPEINPSTGELHNCCVLIDPNGTLIGHYRKRFLYLDEKRTFIPGDRSVLFSTDRFEGALTICYDFVFGEYISKLVDDGAELICHPTAWLTTDVCEQWHYSPMAYRAMGMTRALENTVFYVSANLWGNYDSAGQLRAIGQSSIIAPWGEVLAEVQEGEDVAVATIDFDMAAGWRKAAAPYLEDRHRISL